MSQPGNRKAIFLRLLDGVVIGIVMGAVGTIVSIFLGHLWTTASGYTEAVVKMDRALVDFSETIGRLSMEVEDLKKVTPTSLSYPTSLSLEFESYELEESIPEPVITRPMSRSIPSYEQSFNK